MLYDAIEEVITHKWGLFKGYTCSRLGRSAWSEDDKCGWH